MNIEVGFIEGVQHDYEILKKLKSAWDKITIDSKIDEFLQELPVFLDKEKNPEQKIVIFTKSTDTMGCLSGKITDTDYQIKL